IVAIDAARERTRRGLHALGAGARRRVDSARRAVAGTMRTLHAVSPLATLDRGYAIVSRPDDTRWGVVVDDAGGLAPGERIHAHLASGTVAATVLETHVEDAAALARGDVAPAADAPVENRR
ncbi:MAG: hypothetical protein OXM56_13470, partial [Gammaproteobacteria bacterium]|nr:hypothetical protein [Gammaproteobacteria bacterium]